MLKEEFDIKPRACFDNFIFHVQNIHPADTMKSLDLSDTVLLIAIENEKARGSLYQQAAMAVPDAFIEVIPLCNEEKRGYLKNRKRCIWIFYVRDFINVERLVCKWLCKKMKIYICQT